MSLHTNINSKDLKSWFTDHFKELKALHTYHVPDSEREFQIFEEPLIGIGDAEDPLFGEYKKEDIIGPWFVTPKEWFSEAKSVISIFFPFTETLRENNRSIPKEPAPIWNYGRLEGQEFINHMVDDLCEYIKFLGYETVIPTRSKLPETIADRKFKPTNKNVFISHWSERHAAYVCGLGMFGLSKGLITKKGMAGRITSVLISVELKADVRPYKEIYEYCIMCGACIHRCPSNAISETGKDNVVCKNHMETFKEKFYPRTGCGKCQVKVPCEHQIPGRQML